MPKSVEELIQANPNLRFLRSPEFTSLPQEKQNFILELFEDVEFWRELEAKPHSGDGFKFLAATFGLENARAQADEKKLEGKEREKFLRAHQDLYTMFNPYSGNAQKAKQEKQAADKAAGDIAPTKPKKS